MRMQMNTIIKHGEMSEWFMELVLKTSDRATGRGFESLSLRQKLFEKSAFYGLFGIYLAHLGS